MKVIPLILILIASCINNLIIPYIIYAKIHGLFKPRDKEFIGVNMWGVIMDGILAGLINILALNFLLEMKPIIYMQDVIICLVLGFLFMVGCHIYMSVNKWRIWIMPKPWHWNAAGYWHMVSMSIQMAFLFYPVLILLKHPILFTKPLTKVTLLSVFILTIIFLAALRVHLKGLRIGKLHISKEFW